MGDGSAEPVASSNWPKDVSKILDIKGNATEVELNGAQKSLNPGRGDFVLWPGKCDTWDFKNCAHGNPVEHYPRGSSEHSALEINDSMLDELSNFPIPAGKKRHLILALGYNFKNVAHPKHNRVVGSRFDMKIPHLATHQSVVDKFEGLGFTVRVINTYNGRSGGYNGTLARDTYNNLAKDP